MPALTSLHQPPSNIKAGSRKRRHRYGETCVAMLAPREYVHPKRQSKPATRNTYETSRITTSLASQYTYSSLAHGARPPPRVGGLPFVELLTRGAQHLTAKHTASKKACSAQTQPTFTCPVYVALQIYYTSKYIYCCSKSTNVNR